MPTQLVYNTATSASSYDTALHDAQVGREMEPTSMSTDDLPRISQLNCRTISVDFQS